ncbi:hypothetical protein [Microbacterium sp. NPDC089188]|uniref:hypothetical protein n=1 Tax=Microbacterium sp. NPDC089188 TaxID=3154971 RepID=UPI00342ADD99
MSGIGQSTGILAARNGLWAAIQAATAHRGSDIDRYYATPETVASTKWVGLTDLDVDPDLTNIGARRQFDEAIRVGVNLGAWRAGHGEDDARETFAEAYEILAEIQDHITQNDITLGGAVLWCLPGRMSNAGVEVPGSDGGYVVEIVAEFVCAHRVRPT